MSVSVPVCVAHPAVRVSTCACGCVQCTRPCVCVRERQTENATRQRHDLLHWYGGEDEECGSVGLHRRDVLVRPCAHILASPHIPHKEGAGGRGSYICPRHHSSLGWGRCTVQHTHREGAANKRRRPNFHVPRHDHIHTVACGGFLQCNRRPLHEGEAGSNTQGQRGGSHQSHGADEIVVVEKGRGGNRADGRASCP